MRVRGAVAVLLVWVFKCPFCNRFRDEVQALVAGPSCFICARCIETALGAAEAGQGWEHGPCVFCTGNKIIGRNGELMGTTTVFLVESQTICQTCAALAQKILDEKLAGETP